jgi:hypothetical protein
MSAVRALGAVLEEELHPFMGIVAFGLGVRRNGVVGVGSGEVEEGDGPPWHIPSPGSTPPSLFALTPHASINVGHVSYDKERLRVPWTGESSTAHAGLARFSWTATSM